MIGGLIFRSYNGKNATLYGKGAYFAKAGNYSYAAQQLYAKPHSDGTQRLILTWVLEGERTIGYFSCSNLLSLQFNQSCFLT
jgi:hypothetical protein